MIIHIQNFIKKNLDLISLILLVIITRILLIYPDVIPFAFDHGKDSLAILHMWLMRRPKFIGPWTSIPGLYFGPAWYYLLLPAYIIFNGHPVGAVYLMILLLCIQVYLAYKYFNKYTALLIACNLAWITISTSAWNPFPMTLISFVILIVIQRIIKQKKISIKQSITISLFASLGFHFSTAFSIFYPILIALSLWKHKIKINFKIIAASILGFIIPFIPQLLFEFKNSFVQTKAIINYLQEGESQQISLLKIANIIKVGSGEIKLAILPEIWTNSNLITSLLSLLASLILLFGIYTFMKGKLKFALGFELVTWTLIPLLGFSFLHFNYWYLLAILPIYVIFIGFILKLLPDKLLMIFIVMLILTPISKVIYFQTQNKQELQQSRSFLPVKIKALNKVEELANGQSYSSYHFVPDIYDYSYQYLYFIRALEGHKLPKTFSYQPNTYDYVVQKPELLQKFKSKQFNKPEEKKFFIVEKPEKQEILDRWWGNQQYGEIIQTIKISDEITVYEASKPE